MFFACFLSGLNTVTTMSNKFGDEELNYVLFGFIPKHENLCCLTGTIDLSENVSTLSNKAYQCQIFKCRCLIFSVPEVIASPVLGAVQHIYIIVSLDFYQSDKLTPHLERIKIKVDDPIPLTNAVYEACLRYTILARLAPSWNQVERYLVHGRDFLLSSAPLDAVKLDIVINETDMHIILWPLRFRLPQVCAQDFQNNSFDSPFSWNFNSHNQILHVLPSLNQANVIMVTQQIPQNSLFKSYKDLKRHWKNSYGYRLPDSEEGMIYLIVKFGRWFSESLTYPIVCVKAKRPVFLRQREPQKVLLNLVADLHAKIPYICGYPFGVDTSIRYAVPKLNVISEALFSCNLSETPLESKKHAAMEEVGCNQPIRQYSQSQKPTAVEEDSVKCSQPVSEYSQSLTLRPDSQYDSKVRSTSTPLFLPRQSQLIPPSVNKPLFVPVFTPKTSSKHFHPQSSFTPASLSPPVTTSEEKPEQPLFRGIPMRPVFGIAHVASPSNFNITKPLASNVKTCRIPSFPIFNSQVTNNIQCSSKGEKTPLHLSETAISKKVRNKPQVQQGVDVKSLAHTKDGLSKVNTTTLIAYLRSEGVHCKVKDKKGDLVAKVLAHLNLHLPTQATPTTPPPSLSSPRAIDITELSE